ncbi:NYN domain-containing protein [Ruegeria hyattellae]|uniref:NYN domain-containing protein n=1 Tax=Ruegeria hyattellae TaxID=3233337 RepID=UPI00355AFBD1
MFLFVILCLIGVVVALILPAWSSLLLLAGPCAVAGILILLHDHLMIARWSGRDDAPPAKAPRSKGPRTKPARGRSKNWIILDGSNVMYWKDGTPQIETVREVVDHLTRLGYAPGVMFDANAGYLISGTYRHDAHLGRMLGLKEERVMVVPKGVPADPYILTAARDLGGPVVTNDRYRDWVDDHPEIIKPGHLIRGGYKSGRLWLDLGVAENRKATANAVPGNGS